MSIISLTGVGDSRDKPRVLGTDDGSETVFVETTGLYEGLPKGTQAWVTGSKVQVGLLRGNLIRIGTSMGDPVVTKVTRIPASEPKPIAESHPWSPEPAPEPAPSPLDELPEPDPAPEADDGDTGDAGDVGEPAPYNPAEHTPRQVLAYIKDHPDEAGMILAAERAGKNRKTILSKFD